MCIKALTVKCYKCSFSSYIVSFFKDLFFNEMQSTNKMIKQLIKGYTNKCD